MAPNRNFSGGLAVAHYGKDAPMGELMRLFEEDVVLRGTRLAEDAAVVHRWAPPQAATVATHQIPRNKKETSLRTPPMGMYIRRLAVLAERLRLTGPESH